jgi:curved DNA-binding protein CbpA
MKRRKRYYQALGVPKDATPAEVKRAYRELAKELHPDRVQDPKRAREAEERLKEINAAWNEYRSLLRKGTEAAVRRHNAHDGRAARPHDEDSEWREAAEQQARAARRRGERPSRDRYRAERVRAARDNAERERRARERAEEVRRERASVTYEYRASEHEFQLKLVRFTLAGLASAAGVILILLVAVLLAISFG